MCTMFAELCIYSTYTVYKYIFFLLATSQVVMAALQCSVVSLCTVSLLRRCSSSGGKATLAAEHHDGPNDDNFHHTLCY